MDSYWVIQSCSCRQRISIRPRAATHLVHSRICSEGPTTTGTRVSVLLGYRYTTRDNDSYQRYVVDAKEAWIAQL
jgi:hypothetical protein